MMTKNGIEFFSIHIVVMKLKDNFSALYTFEYSFVVSNSTVCGCAVTS